MKKLLLIDVSTDEVILKNIVIEKEIEIDSLLRITFCDDALFLFGCDKNSNYCIMKGKMVEEDDIEFSVVHTIRVECDPDKAFTPVALGYNICLIPVYADSGYHIDAVNNICDEIIGLSVKDKNDDRIKVNFSEGVLIDGIYYTINLSSGILNCINMKTGNTERKELFLSEKERKKIIRHGLKTGSLLREYPDGLIDYINYVKES